MIPWPTLRTNVRANLVAYVGGLLVLMAILSPVASLAGEWPISGRVLRVDGEPIHGAVVEILPRIGSWDRLQHRLEGTEREVADRTVTGPTGSFELPPQPLGLWTLRVRADGMLDAHRHLPGAWPGGLLEDLTMLPADKSVRVQVVDADGRPIEGAEVDVSLDWQGHPWKHAADHEGLVTDADGRVRVPCPAVPTEGRDTHGRRPRDRVPRDRVPRDRVRAVARLPHDAGQWHTSSVEAAEGPGRLTLAIAGRTTNARLMQGEQPMADVAVLDPLGPVAISDEAGRVMLPDLGRDWRLALRFATRDRLLDWALKSTDPLVLEIRPPATWSGQVVSSEGDPVADAFVFTHWRQPEPLFARTDRHGIYSVAPSFGLWGLAVGAVGYLPTTVRVERQQLEAHVGGEIQLPKAVLKPAASVEAQVVDTAGRALSGVRVEVLVQQAPSDGARGDSLLERSDTEGRLVLRGMMPGAAALALLQKDGFARHEVSFVVPTDPSSAPPLRWVMESGVEVFGRVVDEDGEPVVDASIELMPTKTEDMPDAIRYARGMGERQTVTSNAEGTFTWGGVATGAYRLRAEAEGLLEAAMLFEVETPGPRDLGDVELGAGRSIEGVVIDDQTGFGLADVQVVARTERRGLVASAETDAAGQFTLKALPEQRITIQAGGEEYRGSGSTVRPPFPDSVELRLQRASGISGWVVDPGGTPVPDSNVKIVWTGEEGGVGSTSGPTKDGYFEAKGKGPGAVVITASAPKLGSGRYTGKIGVGEHREVNVILQPGVPFNGVVVDGREAVTDAEVFVALPDDLGEDWQYVHPAMLPGLTNFRTRVDGNGRFAFPSLEPTVVTLLVDAEGYETYRQDVDLRSGGADLTVELKKLAEVRGLLLDASGQPVAGAKVYASSGATHAETVTASDGTFTLDVGEPGFLRIHPPRGPSLHRRDPEAVLGGGILRIVLPEPAAEIAATIFGLDESQRARADLRATGEVDGGWSSSASGSIQPDGSGIIRGLYAGRWNVVASSGELRRTETVDVAAGTSRHVELDFTGDVDLLLSFKLDGKPPVGLAVSAEPQEGPGADCRTDSLGRCLLSGLKLGRTRLRIGHWRSGLQHSQWLQVTGAPEDRIALQTSRIAGHVVPSQRAPVFLSQGDQSVRVWADEDGAFDFRTAFVGQAELRAGAGEADADSGLVVETVPGTELTGLVLTLPAEEPSED